MNKLIQWLSSKGLDRSKQSTIFRYTIVYILISFLWVFSTDWLIHRLIFDPGTNTITSTIKGWFFIAMTALFWHGVMVLNARNIVESQSAYRFLFDQVGVGMALVTPTGQWLRVNQRLCDMLGYSQQEMLTKTFQDLTHPDDVTDNVAALHRLVANEIQNYSREKRYIRKDGSTLWVNLTVTVHRNAAGIPEHMMSVIEDISERLSAEQAGKQAEQQIADALSYSHTILEAAPIGLITYKESGEAISANQSAAEITGATIEQLQAQNFRELKSWQQSGLLNAASEALVSGEEHSIEVRGVSSFGKELWLSARFVPFIHQGNKELLGVFSDISERKQAEEELRFFGEIMTHMVEAVYLVRMDDGVITFANPNFEMMFGYDPGEMQGKHVSIVNDPRAHDPRQTATDIMETLNRTGFWHGEVQNIKKDGTSFWTYARVTVFDHSKYGRVLVSIQTDITERLSAEQAGKLAEIALQTKNEEYESLNEELRSSLEELQAAEEELRSQHEELQQTEEVLRMSERKFSDMAINSPGLVYQFRVLKDGAIDFLYMSPKATEMFGIPSDASAVEWNPARDLHPDDVERFVKTIRTSIEEITPHSFEGRFITAKGIVWFQALARPMMNHNELLFNGIILDITERKRAEEKLQQSEASLTEAQRIARIGSWEWYIGTNDAHWSDETYRIFGLTPSKLDRHRESFLHMIHPDDRARVDQALSDAIQGVREYDLDYRISLADATEKVINAQAEVVRNSDGKPLLMRGTVQDITERKAVDEALRKSNDKYRTLFDLAADTIFIHDTTGQMLAANSIAYNRYGYSETEFLKLNISAIDTPSESVYVPQRIAKLIEEGVLQFETAHQRRDGTLIPVEVNAKRIIWEDKPAIISISRDITERKKSETSLRESEKKFKSYIENAPIGIFLSDENGNYVLTNDEASVISGYGKDELFGMNLMNLVYEEDKPIVIDQFKTVVKSGMIFSENRFVKKNGDIGFWLLKGIKVAQDRYLGFVVDITERKRGEEALRNAQKLESIGTLAGGIAHDFNNLLNAMIGQSDLAIRKLPKESAARVHIDKSIKAAERAAVLTRQLLAYSGKGKFVTEEIDLNLIVNENVQMFETSVPKVAQLQFALDSTSPRIVGDVGQIQQVVMNLIINAGEAMGLNPGLIRVRTDRIDLTNEDIAYWKYTGTPLEPGKYALLQVSDNGCGMSQETVNRIFDPFFTTKFTGRGLGLAAVLGIIRGHKGGIQIESKIGEGSHFDVVFPMVTISTMSEVSEATLPPVIEGNGKVVLLIDDEPSVLELLTDIFTETKFTVISASNPMEGIELYRQHQKSISMVILDYSMPGMDGKAAFDELIKINSEAKVLLCSGYTEEEMMAAFGTVRPSGFMHKPYKPAKLLERVSRMLSE